MPPYAAAIFDLDGTLIDTERLVIDAGLAVLARFGFEVDAQVLTSLVGIVEDEGDRLLAERLGQKLDMAQFKTEWGIGVTRAYAAGIPLMSGVDDLLTQLSSRNVPRAVATNSATENAHRKLGEAGIAHHFDVAHIIGFDAVPNPKPAPDVFLTAARRLGVAPERCVAFEDSDTGVAAALAAGMTVVQIPDMHPAGTRDAHHLADSILAGARACGLID